MAPKPTGQGGAGGDEAIGVTGLLAGSGCVHFRELGQKVGRPASGDRSRWLGPGHGGRKVVRTWVRVEGGASRTSGWTACGM